MEDTRDLRIINIIHLASLRFTSTQIQIMKEQVTRMFEDVQPLAQVSAAMRTWISQVVDRSIREGARVAHEEAQASFGAMATLFNERMATI